jgi:hypothetical protein
MEEYLKWFVTLEPFYRILVAGATLVGFVALLFGLQTGNVAFLAVGVFWLVVVVGAVRVVTRREDE